MSSSHISFFVQSVKILQKYSLSSIMEGIPIADINSMILTHQDKLKECDSYEKAKVMGNEMLTKSFGFPIKIGQFISSDDDLRSLYGLLVAWRDSLIPAVI